MTDVTEERWHTGIGDGAGVYLCKPGEALNSHEKIADFGRGGRAPGGSEAAVARAHLASKAPELLDALGRAQDRIENLIGALSLPIPERLHLEGIRGTLPSIRDEIRAAIAKIEVRRA